MDTRLTLTNDMLLVLGLTGFVVAMFMFERIRSDDAGSSGVGQYRHA